MSAGLAPIPDVRASSTRRTQRLNAPLVIGGGIIALLMALSFIVPALSPHEPRIADALAADLPPSGTHPFGTDESGFDLFVRVLYAPRVDITIAFVGVGIGLVIGVVLGLVAGFARGIVGQILIRATDLLQAFPVLILALALTALLGNSTRNVMFALAFVNAPIFLRLVRGRVLTVRELRYVQAAVALGNPTSRLLRVHVLPNSIQPVLVQWGISMGWGILITAALAFLGVGVQIPTPEWGAMISVGARNLTTGQWWTIVFPGLGLALAVCAFNLISEGIDGLWDVRR